MHGTIPCTTLYRNHDAAPATLPEAACSVNMRFTVDGYSDYAQATGRGATPEEAARNLKQTMDATRAMLAPPAPPTREQRLGQLLTCGLRRATTKGDWALVERLSKAAALVLSGAVEPTERAQAMAVRSAAQPDTWYAVESGACSCPDWQRHREEGYACKHVLAVWLARKVDATVTID